MTHDEDKSEQQAVRADRGGVGFLLNQAARAVRAQLLEDLRHHDLTHTDFIIIRNVLGAYQGGVGATTTPQVSASLNIPQETLDESARRLERMGWLQVSVKGNQLELAPTQKAVGTIPVIADAARWTLERALNGFSREEIATLSDMLERIIRNAGAET